jgi:1,4-alpha-glucan branching enzyme
MATKKNIKAATKPKGSEQPEEKVKASPPPAPSEKITTKKSSKGGTAAAKSRTSAKTKTVTKKEGSLTIEFRLDAPGAQAVFIAGDFNGWLVDKDKMAKGKDGIWRKKIRLTHGRYEYQFVVDGNWWTDPDNPNRTWNEFGSQNSVKEV